MIKNLDLKTICISFFTIFLLEGLILLVLCSFGFKFTYAPELSISWDATETIGTWFGAFITLSAVLAAIIIPYQDRVIAAKIELFSHRFEVYNAIHRIITDHGGLKKYLQGEEAEEFMRTFRKMKFLVSEKTRTELRTLIDREEGQPSMVLDKATPTSATYKVYLNPNAIQALDELLKPYLDVSDFGV